MKKAEVDKYKKKLEEMRYHMTHSLKGSAAEVKQPDDATGYSQHQADQGSDDFDRNISIELTSKEFGILRQIDRALEKINDGTYGICDVSGAEIPKARLDAVPYATMTVKAQEQLERGLL
jgi:DnaK suppressor protein